MCSGLCVLICPFGDSQLIKLHADLKSNALQLSKAVTKKTLGSDDFRSALENGVLLCDLINNIKPGIIKRVNRLPTPIAGLDNLNVFLKACGKLGLKEAQLFHPGDLQDLSTRVTVKHQETNRRLKNVLITIYWLGRRAQCDRIYDGPYLNFKAFEGLLGTALYKALQESPSQKGSSVRDSGFGDSWYSEREELFQLREGGGGGGGGGRRDGHRRDDSLDSLDSLGSRPQSISSEITLKGSVEAPGFCSDTEVDSAFRMAENKDGLSYRRSVVIKPKATAQFNQFLPSKDKASAYVPAPLRKKRAERNEDHRRSWANPIYTEDEGALTRQHQMQESIDGSKSTSDIQVEPSVNRQVRYEELQQVREKTKESDDKWQDDLSKWKNRRRSVNSDIVKKKEEREKVEETTYSSGSSSGNRRSKTLKEMQEERGNKRNSIGSRISSLSYLDDDEVFDKPVTSPRTRALPARSYTIDTPYHSSEPSLKEVEPPAASPATGRAASPPTSREVDIVDRSAGSYATTTNTPTFTPRSRRSPSPAPLERSPVTERKSTVKTEETTTNFTPSFTPSSRRSPSPAPLERSPVTERKSTVKTEETTTTFIPSLIPSITPSIRRSHSPTFAPLKWSPVTERKGRVETEETTTTVISSSSSVQKVPEPRRPLSRIQTEVGAPSSGFLYKQQPQTSSMEPKPPGVSHVSASLPRSYQKSDSARITSVVTARPFGTQSSRLSSLSRPFIAGQTDTAQKRVNGSADVSKKPSVPSRYQQFMTSEDEAQSQSSSVHSSEDEEDEEEEEEKTTAKSMTSTKSVSPVPPQFKSETPVSPAPAKETSQENYSEMRISLNQKPNSSKDFGFQAVWDSTGARVTTIQPGSPAEMCPLQVGDEVLAVNGQQVAEMSYRAWKSSMEEALQEGSLVMDIRHHGKNNWDTDQPSLPYKSHKIINLTSMDHPTLLGSSDSNTVSSSLDFTSRTSMEKLATKEAPAYPVIDVASNRVNGGFREQPVTMRNKESEPISLKNLKRRSEFFEKGGSGSSVSALVYLCGGSESAMPDILVPPIIPSSRWSWDPEEERKRQEKWQKEQERLLQEKYKRDQEKMQEEWMKAQQEVADSVEEEEEPESLVVDRHSLSPHSPVSPFNQPAFLSWEEEGRTRKAEQERQRLEEERERQRQAEEQERQRQAEERRKRDEEERELLRLQEERKQKERQEEEERKMREEEELRWQKRREEEREEDRRRQEVAEHQRRERERALQQQQQQQQWAGDSHGFANVQPSLSFTDRTKSQSSPQLDEEEKPQKKGVYMQRGGMAHWLLDEQARNASQQAQSQRAASELEMERRNILNAMRYREPEKVTGGVVGDRMGNQSQSELERQQILNEMKKKTPMLRDKSWIRQNSAAIGTTQESDAPSMRRGESLDNLDTSYNSWRSSWTPRSASHVPNYSAPYSGGPSLYGGGLGAQRPVSSTLPSSYSMGSLRGGAGPPSSPWSRQSSSPSPSSPSPATSPEPTSEAGAPQQRSSASTVSLNSGDRRLGLKSEYETNSSTVTPATSGIKASQPLCDVTVLQQIDEETTCDNNP
ncbi:LIM domain only protein 7 isoform X5 [Trematomus bernacchii]|uniref:LIM domain only protein 7 isoform X5 n=1 Tax=Trematomus bernacchii TaxID=40690 RepID=UPI00146CF9B9|nr:LIM domain only protein 7 isoform X5 [Trematomus bernacchii]